MSEHEIWCPHCERDVTAKEEEAVVSYTEADTEIVLVCPLCDTTIVSLGEYMNGYEPEYNPEDFI
jgi:C4-type Zn-finger protein